MQQGHCLSRLSQPRFTKHVRGQFYSPIQKAKWDNHLDHSYATVAGTRKGPYPNHSAGAGRDLSNSHLKDDTMIWTLLPSIPTRDSGSLPVNKISPFPVWPLKTQGSVPHPTNGGVDKSVDLCSQYKGRQKGVYSAACLVTWPEPRFLVYTP